MNRQSSIALVTSLFILVTVMLIGLGSIFLTRNNLKVSENIRSNAVARNNAESGVEAVYLLLSSYHDTYSTFPTDQSSIKPARRLRLHPERLPLRQRRPGDDPHSRQLCPGRRARVGSAVEPVYAPPPRSLKPTPPGWSRKVRSGSPPTPRSTSTPAFTAMPASTSAAPSTNVRPATPTATAPPWWRSTPAPCPSR